VPRLIRLGRDAVGLDSKGLNIAVSVRQEGLLMINTSVPVAGFIGGDFRVDRVFRQTSAVFSRNFPIFFAVTAVARVPDLLVSKLGSPTAVTSSSGMLWRLLDVFVFIVCSTLAEAVVLRAAFEDMRGRRAQLTKSIRAVLGSTVSVVGLAMFMAFGIMVGAFFLVVPALFLLTMWYVATPACVVERLTVSKSIDRSAQLTRGHRYKIFGMIMFLFIADAVGAGILDAVLRLGGSAVLTKTGVFIWNSAWAAFYAVFGVVTYHDLRVAKEGTDIHQIASVFD
jgi:hypothetical protein